ncbi:hypothetical protein T265_06516 [Opisthorchis viverrini]|uniref:Reverse transcriptase domain-containing protein n=1 Tax=Opisthorchis viverrini TaxID=6198 RepID=A0A074ZFX7_OPIVI|nr:hypothetical protein T265_06516 [Opisthorchis viverrini]KER26156.1 hypothetical protein T265_06516 [Opisthorchis viverrini]
MWHEFVCVCAVHGCTRAGILPGCPHLDRRTIRVLNQSLWLKSLTSRQWCLAGNANALPFLQNKSPHVPTPNLEGQETVFVRPLPMDQPGMRDSLNGSLRCANRHITVRSSLFVTVIYRFIYLLLDSQLPSKHDWVLRYVCDYIDSSDLTLPIPTTSLKELLLRCTFNTQLQFNSALYSQIDEVAMGSPLGPLLSDIFVGKLERRQVNGRLGARTSIEGT